MLSQKAVGDKLHMNQIVRSLHMHLDSTNYKTFVLNQMNLEDA